jgi:hypothetical protein
MNFPRPPEYPERVGELLPRAAFPAIIVSGGQTGADRGALDFAIAHKIPHAGFCPRGRKAEDGRISDCYKLTETKSSEYPERTRRNVGVADATIIFGRASSGPLLEARSGSGLTAREAARAGRPFLLLANFPSVGGDADELCHFICAHRPRILNVAGARESSLPGISVHVAAVLAAVAEEIPRAAAQDLLGRGAPEMAELSYMFSSADAAPLPRRRSKSYA